MLIVLLRKVAEQNIERYINRPIYSGIPFISNLPYSTIGGLGYLFNITSCDIWWLYEIDEEAPEGTAEFFGENKGYPMHRPTSSGMINGETGIMQTACPE